MKLYFVSGETKILVGEPRNPEELGRMLIEDGKKKFVAFQGHIEFAFAAGTEFAVNSSTAGGGKYLLED